MGVLTGKGTGILRIEDSLFENNGYEGSALGHNIYAQGENLEFIRSKSLRARNQGHEIKSRARRTIIDHNLIASLESQDSRSIDVPNGGEIIIKHSLIQKGANSSNVDMIGVGLENVIMHRPTNITIESNTIIFDTSRFGPIVNYRNSGTVTITGNTIIARWNPDLPGNVWFPTRARAGLPDYPALPGPGNE
jgi:hypothetical protein